MKDKIQSKKFPFQNAGIWTITDEDGGVIWINLYNVCLSLKRKEMYESGKVLEICRNNQKFPMYGNGKLFWFTRIADILALCRTVRKDSSMAAKLCDELETWLAKLPVGKEIDKDIQVKGKISGNSEIKIIIPPQKQKIAYKKDTKIETDGNKGAGTAKPREPNSLIVLEYEDQPISFKHAENGMTYTNATEMSRRYDKKPYEWLVKADTLKFRQFLVEQGITPDLESQIITTRGSMGATYLEQHLAVEYARWLDPNFAIWMNKTNQELVEQGFVVLKKDSLQTTTSVDEILQQFGIPQTKSEALLLAAAYAKKIEEDKPKVDYYIEMVENREEFTSTQLALELNISVIRLHQFLVDERIVKYESRKYVVYASHQALQKDHPYMWTNKQGKTYAYAKAKRWTKAGRDFIIELYKDKNPN